jgi:tRNA A-37 threonylcarbamoyl transferase component Bud32
VVENKFKSKKNEVYGIKCTEKNGEEKKYILKVYKTSAGQIEKEFKMLTKLREKGVSVPQVYYVGKDYLMMEYIKGYTLLEHHELNEQIANTKEKQVYQTSKYLIRELFQWLYKFYSAAEEFTGTKIIFKDINLRNFIVKDQIYGVDFEDCCQGDVEEDTGRLCAYILTYSPAFTCWKIEVVKEIYNISTKEYSQDGHRIIKEMEKELEEISKRRRMNISPYILIKLNFIKESQ